MATPLIRLAAGAGVVVAVVTVTVAGAGAAVSAADPGGSRASSSQPRDGGRSDRHPNGHGGRGQQVRDHDRRDGPGRGEHDLFGRRGSEDRSSEDSSGPTDRFRLAGRDAATGQTDGSPALTIASRSATATSVAEQDSNPTPPAPIAQLAPGASPGRATGVDRHGSSFPIASVQVPTVAPRVTIGDGRSHVFASARPDELPEHAAPAPAHILLPKLTRPPVVAPPSPLPPATLPPTAPRAVELFQPTSSGIPAASAWGTLERGWPAGALFGLAGLILAPIAGAWLGHRQARAAKAATEFVDG